MTETVDVVIIGAGHNALIAAARLGEAGASVQVIEQADHVGGALCSAEVTEPGFVSDLYATNLNLLLNHPGVQRWKDRLEAHGLRLATSSSPYANVYPDGTTLKVHQTVERTEQSLGAHSEADLAGWRELHAAFGEFAQTLLPLYGPPLPAWGNVRDGLKAVRTAGLKRTVELGRIITATTRELGDVYFHTPEAKALAATWGMHMDYGPDVAFGAMFPFIETFSDMENGITITGGGASQFADALAGVVQDFGGQVRTGTAVTRVLTAHGRATGVELSDGTTVHARQAVMAGTGPDALFNGLLAEDQVVDSGTRRNAARYQYGPGTMMIHLSLDEPVPWSPDRELGEFAYIHIAPYVDDLARTYQQAQAGTLPDSPLLIVGQSSVVDPERAPEGKHVLWVQVRALPSDARADSLGEISPAPWDRIKEAYADRVMTKLEHYAPGLRERVRQRTVLSPTDLERANPNLVGGDSIGGSHHFWQFFMFRPWPGSSNYRMPVEGLYMLGAATWPGGGLNGMSGWNAAGQLLDDVGQGGPASKIGKAVRSLPGRLRGSGRSPRD